jgi:hypothetical protein
VHHEVLRGAVHDGLLLCAVLGGRVGVFVVVVVVVVVVELERARVRKGVPVKPLREEPLFGVAGAKEE